MSPRLTGYSSVLTSSIRSILKLSLSQNSRDTGRGGEGRGGGRRGRGRGGGRRGRGRGGGRRGRGRGGGGRGRRGRGRGEGERGRGRGEEDTRYNVYHFHVKVGALSPPQKSRDNLRL